MSGNVPTVAQDDLRAVQRAFEEYGRCDPMYAALARGGYAWSGTVHSLLYRLNRIHFRRFQQWIRGRPAYEMHFVARETVESAVREAGGHVADVVDLSRSRPNRSLRYCVTA